MEAADTEAVVVGLVSAAVVAVDTSTHKKATMITARITSVFLT